MRRHIHRDTRRACVGLRHRRDFGRAGQHERRRGAMQHVRTSVRAAGGGQRPSVWGLCARPALPHHHARTGATDLNTQPLSFREQAQGLLLEGRSREAAQAAQEGTAGRPSDRQRQHGHASAARSVDGRAAVGADRRQGDWATAGEGAPPRHECMLYVSMRSAPCPRHPDGSPQSLTVDATAPSGAATGRAESCGIIASTEHAVRVSLGTYWIVVAGAERCTSFGSESRNKSSSPREWHEWRQHARVQRLARDRRTRASPLKSRIVARGGPAAVWAVAFR